MIALIETKFFMLSSCLEIKNNKCIKTKLKIFDANNIYTADKALKIKDKKIINLKAFKSDFKSIFNHIKRI